VESKQLRIIRQSTVIDLGRILARRPPTFSIAPTAFSRSTPGQNWVTSARAQESQSRVTPYAMGQVTVKGIAQTRHHQQHDRRGKSLGHSEQRTAQSGDKPAQGQKVGPIEITPSIHGFLASREPNVTSVSIPSVLASRRSSSNITLPGSSSMIIVDPPKLKKPFS